MAQFRRVVPKPGQQCRSSASLHPAAIKPIVCRERFPGLHVGRIAGLFRAFHAEQLARVHTSGKRGTDAGFGELRGSAAELPLLSKSLREFARVRFIQRLPSASQSSPAGRSAARKLRLFFPGLSRRQPRAEPERERRIPGRRRRGLSRRRRRISRRGRIPRRAPLIELGMVGNRGHGETKIFAAASSVSGRVLCESAVMNVTRSLAGNMYDEKRFSFPRVYSLNGRERACLSGAVCARGGTRICAGQNHDHR